MTSTEKLNQDHRRRRRDLVRLISAGRKCGMDNAALIRAGIRRADLGPAPVDAADRPPAWKPGTEPTIADVANAFVAASAGTFFEVTLDDLKSPRKNLRITSPRMVAMWTVRTILKSGASFPSIAHFFGGRHHTTVIHAFEDGGKEQMQRYPELRDIAESVRRKFVV